jgi:hypothetical protein
MEILLIWLICGIGAALVAGNKGRSMGTWFVGGLAFGVFALLYALTLSARHCAFCRKAISWEATRCPYCQSDIAAEAEMYRLYRAEQQRLGRRDWVIWAVIGGLAVIAFVGRAVLLP